MAFVVFSWITRPSSQVRGAGMKKAVAGTHLRLDVNPLPFDGQRPIRGGFEGIVDA